MRSRSTASFAIRSSSARWVSPPVGLFGFAITSSFDRPVSVARMASALSA